MTQESKFGPDFFGGNRQLLRKKLGNNGIVVLTAQTAIQKTSDETYPFRQDSSFWYFSSVDVQDVLLVIDLESKTDTLIFPKRSDHHDLWEGAIDYQAVEKNSGAEVISGAEGQAFFKQIVSKSKKIHHLKALDLRLAKLFGMSPNPSRHDVLRKIKRINPKTELVPINEIVASLRMVKQTCEIEAIERAVDITNEAFLSVRKQFERVQYEYQAEAILGGAMRFDGSESYAYEPIVAGGKNAATIHYMKNNQEILSKDMLLIDAGAKSGMYCADITRMYAPKSGMSVRQQEVVDAVARAKTRAEESYGPNKTHRQLEQLLHEYVADELVGLSLISDAKDKESVHKYYPHRGHSLGIDVHDPEDFDMPLVPGVVLTIEPGIYIPDENIGVRLEDDYVITKDGIRRLGTKTLPYVL